MTDHVATALAAGCALQTALLFAPLAVPPWRRWRAERADRRGP